MDRGVDWSVLRVDEQHIVVIISEVSVLIIVRLAHGCPPGWSGGLCHSTVCRSPWLCGAKKKRVSARHGTHRVREVY